MGSCCGSNSGADSKKKVLRNPFEDADGDEMSDGSQPKKIRGSYNLDGPSNVVGVVIRCFEQGLLYRIVDDNSLYFYNDSLEYEARIMYEIGSAGAEDLEYGPRTVVTKGRDGSMRVSLSLVPGETVHFLTGAAFRAAGFRSNFQLAPLTDERIARMRRDNEERLAVQMVQMQRYVGRQIPSLAASAAAGGLAVMAEPEMNLAARLCAANRMQYIDLSFPPLVQSIFGASHQVSWTSAGNLPWLRPGEFLPRSGPRSKVKVAQQVGAGSLVPGELGDFAFMCAIAALSEIKTLVQRLFPRSRLAGSLAAVGAYVVRICHDGRWVAVLVDSLLPCRGLRPAFARNGIDRAEMWPSLLQKAWAKIHGSYFALLRTDVCHALNDLTGYPVTKLDPEWEAAKRQRAEEANNPVAAASSRGKQSASNSLFESLKEYQANKFLVLLSTPSANDRAFAAGFGCRSTADLSQRYESSGLSLGYSYMVLKLVQHGGIRLVKLRNPWSRDKEWSGRFSDRDRATWNKYPELERACGGVQDRADGCFFMHFDDVLDYFDGGAVCRARVDWTDYRILGNFTGGVSSFALEITNHQRPSDTSSTSQHSSATFDLKNDKSPFGSFSIGAGSALGCEKSVKISITLTQRRTLHATAAVKRPDDNAIGNDNSNSSSRNNNKSRHRRSLSAHQHPPQQQTASRATSITTTKLVSNDQNAVLISLWRVDKADNSYVLIGNSTANPERTTSAFNYLYSRDVSVELTVPPGETVLVVPHAYNFLSAPLALAVQTSHRFSVPTDKSLIQDASSLSFSGRASGKSGKGKKSDSPSSSSSLSLEGDDYDEDNNYAGGGSDDDGVDNDGEDDDDDFNAPFGGGSGRSDKKKMRAMSARNLRGPRIPGVTAVLKKSPAHINSSATHARVTDLVRLPFQRRAADSEGKFFEAPPSAWLR